MSDFQIVMQRVRSALKLKDEKALAAELGLKPNAFYNRRSAGSLPFEGLMAVIEKHKMCADWVFFGRGRPFERAEQNRAFQVGIVDTSRFQDVCAEVEAALSSGDSANKKTADARARAALFGGLAAFIYNRVAFITNDAERAAAIRSEAKAMVHAVQLAEDAKKILAKRESKPGSD